MTFMHINLAFKKRNAYSESRSNLTVFLYTKTILFLKILLFFDSSQKGFPPNCACHRPDNNASAS